MLDAHFAVLLQFLLLGLNCCGGIPQQGGAPPAVVVPYGATQPWRASLGWHCPMPVASARAPAKPYWHAGSHAEPAARSPAGARSKLYNPRHPERTVLYRAVAAHFETWLALANAGQFDGQGDHHTPPAYVEQAFRKYLECGVFAHGFARVWCEDGAHDYLVAFACKGRGVCPSCNARRMAQTAGRTWWTMFYPTCRCASGCCLSRSGCVTSCSATGRR